jgi:hypothetical protein
MTVKRDITGLNKSWEFVGGTIMTLSIEVLRYIYDHHLDEVYGLLNYENSEDSQWLKVLSVQCKDPRGCGNDLSYRQRYGKSLLSDYMIEHTYERILGLIVNHVGGIVVGI